MAEVDRRFIKLGFWTNLEQGQVMGSTITTTARTGAIIVAVMAIMSTLGRVTSYICMPPTYSRQGHRTSGAFSHLHTIKSAPLGVRLMVCFVSSRLF